MRTYAAHVAMLANTHNKSPFEHHAAQVTNDTHHNVIDGNPKGAAVQCLKLHRVSGQCYGQSESTEANSERRVMTTKKDIVVPLSKGTCAV